VVVGELGLHGGFDLVVPVAPYFDSDLGHGLFLPLR
jgi:hypothetical protein